MATEVIHVRDMREGDVYIGRAGHGQDGYFGNPHPVDKMCPICHVVHKRGEAVVAYKRTFWARLHKDAEFRKRVTALQGKRIACFCKPNACHGDVIKAWHEAGCPM